MSMNGPCSHLQLHVQCSKLPRKDTLSKSDPFVVIYTFDERNNAFVEYGRTETLSNNHNPDFATGFDLSYFFETTQKLRFDVYDEDTKGGSLQAQDFIGRIDTTLGSIMGEYHGRLTAPLLSKSGKKTKGVITVLAEEAAKSAGVVKFRMRATKVDKKDLFGKSDPYVVISRNLSGSWATVHKTEVVRNTLNPLWAPFEVDLTRLCNGNPETALKFEVFDWDRVGSHDFIGSFETTLAAIQADPHAEHPLINLTKKAKKRSYRNSGVVAFDECTTELRPSFVDYLLGGLQLSCSFAVDFTASNGRQDMPSSLHFNSPAQRSAYATAIEAVGNIIQDYDSDKLFPAFGFGCRLPGQNVTFQLPLNGHYENPMCNGVQGVLGAYYSTLQRVELWGPTNFAPIINITADIAGRHHAAFMGGRAAPTYFILIIITDGVISDMADTMDAVVKASHLPMSIVIIGVGDADFSAMHALDSDDALLESKGVRAERDIVQFVPINQFMSGRAVSGAALARAVLAEIPGQVLQYCRKHNLPAGPRLPPAQPAMAMGSAPAQLQGQASAPPPYSV
ncbi:hypothetical protein PTSG_12171 [Salpingoeca rosetta]|uniref:Copine-3 n=1 Tax=Salpingoeca rosetta (strain ATCC 50818 / BSB-021) TaxID=946362 RepID=F2U8H3_SALR5|nr:uncharacterized protein PTSG_12171 [Salpingoeca rosetta]EGD72681.1 hypothetical protein PTSG_12171 [Salpingoeca rosetta]|eukprot:XP_004994504.1 hypothetical protein PTSG_12171 [Salpingoeca rosetta]